MMDSEKLGVLYEDVKTDQKITWENEDVKKELTGMIADAEIYMNHLLGAELDYSAPGMFHQLFLNFCWYKRNKCEYEFENAYLKDILRCRIYVEVQQTREGKGNEDSSKEA